MGDHHRRQGRLIVLIDTHVAPATRLGLRYPKFHFTSPLLLACLYWIHPRYGPGTQRNCATQHLTSLLVADQPNRTMANFLPKWIRVAAVVALAAQASAQQCCRLVNPHASRSPDRRRLPSG
jgi:hypothetical protein